MDDQARRDAYRRQIGRPDLTPRQRRRADHKLWRQRLREAGAAIRDAIAPNAGSAS